MRTVLTVIGFVVVAAVAGTCVACADDEESSAPAWVYSSRPPDGRPGDARDCDDQCGNQHRDCENNSGECSDDDQVQVGPICIEDGACRFG